VSRRNRCPNWTEMEHVKRMFFGDNETAMHPWCLHLWRPQQAEIPRPPGIMVSLPEPAAQAEAAP
jgi:hypothetical protein